MVHSNKKWVVTGFLLIILGLILFVIGMSLNNWDFTKLSSTKYVTNTHKVTTSFNNIKIDTTISDILFATSSDDTCLVECYETDKFKHFVVVDKDTLTITFEDERKLWERIGFSFGTPKITIYLPQTKYDSLTILEKTGDVEIPSFLSFHSMLIELSTESVMNKASVSSDIQIKTSTGCVLFEDVSCNSLDITGTTGSVTLKNVNCIEDMSIDITTGKTNIINSKCKNLTSNENTGGIYLNNVIVTVKIFIERHTGNVVFDGSDAGEIEVKTSTGDVSGTILTNKLFIASSNTGSIDVPKTTTGGKCEINTSTGNIKITIK